MNNGGQEWVNKQNWMTSAHECNWYGVSCIQYEGMIDRLDLSNNNLLGPMPSELGELRGLRHLVRLKLDLLLFDLGNLLF